MEETEEDELFTKFRVGFWRNDIMTVRKILFFNFKFKNNSNSKNEVELMIYITRNRHGVKKEVFDLVLRFLEFEAVSSTSGSLNDQLKVAIMRGDLQGTESLLKKGATLEGLEWKEYSSVSYIFSVANTRGTRKEMLLLLLEHGLRAVTEKRGDSTLYELLIYYADDVNVHDDLEMANILFDHGMSMYESISNMSPISNSVMWCYNVRLLSFFIDKGVDVNIRDQNGETPLFHAACCSGHEKNKKIRFLLSKGADIKCVNIYQRNAFFELRRRVPGDTYPAARQFIREFSRLAFEGLPVSEIDMKLLREDPTLKKYFEQYTKDLKQMKSYKFYGVYTYYCVLKMSRNIKKLARLTKKSEFVAKFEANLSEFDCYKSDLED